VKYEKISMEDVCTRDDKRRESVTLLCEIRQGTRPWQLVRLDDISRTGFRIAWYPGATSTRPVRIRIKNMEILTAEVRWREGHSLGCEFATPLHVAVFEHMLRQAG
jgi:hypothetical protein